MLLILPLVSGVFFFYPGFLSQSFTILRTAGGGEGYFFKKGSTRFDKVLNTHLMNNFFVCGKSCNLR